MAWEASAVSTVLEDVQHFELGLSVPLTVVTLRSRDRAGEAQAASQRKRPLQLKKQLLGSISEGSWAAHVEILLGELS